MNRTIFGARARLSLAALLVLTGGCVKLPRRAARVGDKASPLSVAPERARPIRISINHATRQELAELPGIGPALAERIVEHRERYGPFRRPAHLMIVRGISERRFHQLRPLLAAE